MEQWRLLLIRVVPYAVVLCAAFNGEKAWYESTILVVLSRMSGGDPFHALLCVLFIRLISLKQEF